MTPASKHPALHVKREPMEGPMHTGSSHPSPVTLPVVTVKQEEALPSAATSFAPAESYASMKAAAVLAAGTPTSLPASGHVKHGTAPATPSAMSAALAASTSTPSHFGFPVTSSVTTMGADLAPIAIAPTASGSTALAAQVAAAFPVATDGTHLPSNKPSAMSSFSSLAPAGASDSNMAAASVGKYYTADIQPDTKHAVSEPSPDAVLADAEHVSAFNPKAATSVAAEPLHFTPQPMHQLPPATSSDPACSGHALAPRQASVTPSAKLEALPNAAAAAAAAAATPTPSISPKSTPISVAHLVVQVNAALDKHRCITQAQATKLQVAFGHMSLLVKLSHGDSKLFNDVLEKVGGLTIFQTIAVRCFLDTMEP